MTTALVFANGEIQDGPMVQRVLTQAVGAFIAVADGGSRVAQHYDLSIHAVIGDMDSIEPELLESLAQSGVEIDKHPKEKDFTDLELALKFVRERGYKSIRIIGGMGGRIDQSLGNIYLLALPELKDADVRIVAGSQEISLLYPGEHQISGAEGDTVSLIPLGDEASGIQTKNLYYPLSGETLYLGPARGISNVMRGETAGVSFDTGLLLLVHTMGRA